MAKTTVNTLEPAHLVAIAGAVKGKALDNAKAALPEASTHRVRIVVEVTGTVQKGEAEQASSGSRAAEVTLLTVPVLLEVFSHFKIGPTRIERALREITASIEDPADVAELGRSASCEKLQTVIEQVAREMSARLPEQPWSRNGRAAAVRSDINLRIIEASPCVSQAA